MRKNQTAYFVVAALLSTTLVPVNAADVDNKAAATQEFAVGKKLYDTKKYAEAQKHLTKAATLASRDASAQYYLALAALQNGDINTFRRALSRIVVARGGLHGVAKQAADLICKYSPNVLPYGCVGASGNVSRFVRKDMPVKIYVSQGLMLPAAYRDKASFRPDEMMKLMTLMRQPGFWTSLEKDPGYNGSLSQAVMSGLHSWDWLRSEGILEYAIVNDPNQANVVVLWCPRLPTDGYTTAMNCGSVGKKVIMQFGTTSDTSRDMNKFAAVAAHEFGHCWGIDRHSPYKDDLMAAMPLSASFSENDKLSIRALYDVAPDTRR